MVFIGLECANYFGLDAKKGLMAAKTTKNFEKSLSELEGIVEKMENGDLSLEESMKQFEKGVELTRICQTALDQAEQKVMLLSTNQEDDSETEFDIDQ